MSLFPFFGDTVTEVAAGTNLPLYKEVAWDFQNNIPKLENGEYEIVTENEAVKTVLMAMDNGINYFDLAVS
mgnify:CR=1 FL=1